MTMDVAVFKYCESKYIAEKKTFQSVIDLTTANLNTTTYLNQLM